LPAECRGIPDLTHKIIALTDGRGTSRIISDNSQVLPRCRIYTNQKGKPDYHTGYTYIKLEFATALNVRTQEESYLSYTTAVYYCITMCYTWYIQNIK
jgi:hypothetical protein